MALAAGTQWESRTGGSDTLCSGGFNPANANFATDGAATSATGNSPVFSSASYNFVAGDVGAWVFVKSGTNWTPGWYQIASVAANAATLSAAIGQGVVYPGAFLTTNFKLMKPATTAGCATVASPTGATWGIDYSQQNAAKHAFTDMVIDAVSNTKFTSAANPVGKNFVGNLVKVTSGSGFTVQTVEVVSTSGTTATCDKSLGTVGSTGGNGYLGGAFAGPQLACAIAVASNVVWIATGSYTMSSTSSNVTLGRVTLFASTQVHGYGALRGDGSTPPTFTASGISSVTMFTGGTSTDIIQNIQVNGASLSTMTGFNSAQIHHSKASNCTTGFGSSATVWNSAADTCTTGFTAATFFSAAKTCTTGFTGGNKDSCIAWTCTTGYTMAAGGILSNCAAYNSTNSFSITNAGAILIDCVADTSSSRAFDFNGGTGKLIRCAAYNSTTADVRYAAGGTYSSSSEDFISLSASPFTNPGAGDFSLNNTSGGGASLRGLSRAFPSIVSTTTYSDAGAAQHQDAGGGGGGGGKIFASSVIQGLGQI